MFRLTCWFSRAVVTPYMTAKSESSITRLPRIKNIRLPILLAGTRGASIAITIYTIDPLISFPVNDDAVQEVLNRVESRGSDTFQNPGLTPYDRRKAAMF